MKRLLICLLLICTLLNCLVPAYADNQLTKAEEKAAKKVHYLTNCQFFYYEKDNLYIVMFSFKNKDETQRLACPCTVEFRLENSEGEVVYSATEHLTVDDFSTWTWSDPDYSHKNGLYGTIRIDPSEIVNSTSSEGTMYIKVYLDGWFDFSESEIKIDVLPMMPILFRGIEWGATESEAQKAYPLDIGSSLIVTHYSNDTWYKIDDWMKWDSEDEQEPDFLREIGYCVELYSSYSGNPIIVAGQEASYIYLYFVYLVGEDGLLSDTSALVYACYDFYTDNKGEANALATYFTDKLSSLYGDIDDSKSNSFYRQNLWLGGDETMVSVVCGDLYPYKASVKYGFRGADKLMTDAYEALLYEESLHGYDGL